MKFSEYAVTNQQAAEELLACADFLQALQGAMNLLGPVFLYHPAKDEAGATAVAAIRNIDVAADWPFGSEEARTQAAQLLVAGATEDDAVLERRFTELFRGPGKLPAAIWGSVYLDHEQVTYGNSWVDLRTWMRAHGITTLYCEKEPEDQIGRMMLLVAQVAADRPDLLLELLGNHLLPWVYRFFDYFTPAAHEASPTYEGFAVLARTTLEDVQDLLGLVPAKRRLFR